MKQNQRLIANTMLGSDYEARGSKNSPACFHSLLHVKWELILHGNAVDGLVRINEAG